MRAGAVQIHGFTGEAISSGGSHYPHPLYLEIGTNHYLSLVSCQIGPAGKYTMIIPLILNKEHSIINLDQPTTWSFHHKKCIYDLLLQDEGISKEWDDEVLNALSAMFIGRIEKVNDDKITIIDRLRDKYHDYLNRFHHSTAEKLVCHPTFN